MIELQIPGRGRITIENVIFDYNGTLAVDGVLSPVVKARLNRLAERLNVYILTADTYGTAAKACEELEVVLKTFPKEKAGREKQKIVRELGGDKSIVVGNGNNDMEMFEESILTFAVLMEEGCYGKLIYCADMVFQHIKEVFDALESPRRIKATLRN